MALVSPGVEVTIIDESQYASARINTVPYILIATAENKINASGTDVAPGTIATDDNNMYLITSQRELVNTFGNPFFYKTAGGDAINGYELNEYGLMAAYSVLGATNRAYIHRVDVDLAELTASLSRPLGNPNNNAFWLDLSETSWGIFEWNSATTVFDYSAPIQITDLDDLDTGVPLASIGNIRDYAVVTTNTSNPVYFKTKNNEWTLIGTDDWRVTIPVVIGTETNPALTLNDEIVINGNTVINPGATLDGLITAITTAAVPGVTAANVDGKIEFYVTSLAVNQEVIIANGGAGAICGDLGIAEATYNAHIVSHGTHTEVPRWRSTDTNPQASGSIWIKTTSVNQGMNLVTKRYDSVTDSFVEQATPVYENDWTANKWIDPGQGGQGIAAGETYAQYDVNENDTGTVTIFTRTPGDTSVTGAVTDPAFVASHEFTVSASLVNDVNMPAPTTVTMTGTTPAEFVADFLAANITNATASVTANNRVNITHTTGGVIILEDTGGSAIDAAGFTSALENVRDNAAGQLILSNWNQLVYSADFVAPGQDPLDGTRWYYSEISEMDILINEAGAWHGYLNVVNDVRGFDLSFTNADGPMLSAVAPDTQEDGTPLMYGDLWVDSSDLENYPLVNRWETLNGLDQWVAIDTADSTSTDGLIFADARWGNNEDVDPITDDMVAINVLNSSDYVDIDAPNPDLYPPGTLLWNTRRSGYNVKEYRVNYFNANDFGNAVIPNETNTWVTVSGLKDDGRANMGRQAQRALVVAAMKAAIDTSEDAREEQREFNLLAAPNYPELIPNMVALNNERNNTGFIIGDTPMRLSTNGADLVEWATNNNGLGTDTGDGLVSNDEYLGVFYPSAKTTDLSGTEVIVPPSHMMLRTIIHSDEQSYPWLAPAGVRRGIVDNAIALGYIDGQTGEFQQKQIRQGVRDVLYQANVNPITFLVGSGITNYGNKTTKPGSALDRINVARLVNYIRKQLEVLAKPFLFEPNDEITRNELKNVIEGLMNDLVAKRGLYDYSVLCDKSNNTPFRIDRNELYVDIAIEPVKAVEFIFIPVRIKNTGEIGGTAS